MKSFKEFITEKTFHEFGPKNREWMLFTDTEINAAKADGKPSLADEIFDLIHKSYEAIGGYPGINSGKDVPGDVEHWWAVNMDKDPEPDAVDMGKRTPAGWKVTGGATDGSAGAKAYLMNKVASLLKSAGNYGEFSGAMGHILIKKGVPCVKDPQTVQNVLRGKKINWIGKHPDGKYPGYEGWYEREIGGHKHLKIMLGHPHA